MKFFVKNKNKRLFVFIFISSLVLSFSVFGNGIPGEFVFDDVTVIQNRGDLKDSGNFFNLFISPYHQNIPKTGLYRPFTTMSYALNYHIFGSSPASFHIINIVIHALNSLLVFWLINYLFKSKRLAFLSFILFLFHPIHTEAVTSIVGRAELWAFLWSLLTAVFFLKKKHVLAGASFFLALISKESALMFLPVILFIDWSLYGRRFVLTLKKLLYFLMPLGAYVALRYAVLGKYFVGDALTTIVENPLKFADWPERIFTASKVLYMYWERLVWSVHLSADYSYNTIKMVSNLFDSWQSMAGLAILVLLIIVLLVPRTRRTALGFGAAVFVVPYLLISNLIFPIGTIMGERLMYLPSFGFVVILALLLSWVIEKRGIYKKIGYAVLAVIVVFYGIRTFIRNQDWQNNDVLFQATAKESPNSLIVRTALAGVYIRDNEWDRAKEQLKIAKNIYEDNSRLQNLLGIVADHNGDYALAEEKYRRSLELNPDAINTRINLSELYFNQGRLKDAASELLKVIDFYPTKERIIRYAYTLISIGEPDEALSAIDKYLGKNLTDANALAAVGTAYFVKGEYKMAVFFLKRAVKLGNDLPDIRNMLKIAEEIE